MFVLTINSKSVFSSTNFLLNVDVYISILYIHLLSQRSQIELIKVNAHWLCGVMEIV